MSIDRAAEARRAALELQELLDAAPCGWVVMELDGTIVEHNATMMTLCGTRALRGTRLTSLLDAGGRIYWSTHCVPLLRLSGEFQEVALELGEGPERTSVLLNARLDEEGLVHATVFDATDRRSYERELLAARRESERGTALLRSTQERLERAAAYDALTELPNRAHTSAVLGEGLRDETQLCVLFIDLDHFKPVNDSLGHEAGDRLLQVLSSRIRAALPPELVLGRWGGDEFLVVAPRNALSEGTQIAEALLEALTQPVDVGRIAVEVGASIGVAERLPGESADSVVSRADKAMYRAKERGRSCWQAADAADAEVIGESVELAAELRRARRAGQLRLYYQPIVELSTGAVTGVEALLRWEHPQRGLLAPVTFLDAAERSGALREFDAWVLEEGIRQGALWNQGRTLTIALNLSAPEMTDPTLSARVLGALSHHGLPAERLTLEITETALLADTEAVLANAHALRHAGVRLALDDFGTGWSGFSYLRRLPVDKLKIDCSFVSGVVDHPTDRAIVRGIITVAQGLGLEVVAEGVESAAQHTALAELGCDTAQGHLYLRPRPASEVEAFLPAALGAAREVELAAACSAPSGAQYSRAQGRAAQVSSELSESSRNATSSAGVPVQPSARPSR